MPPEILDESIKGAQATLLALESVLAAPANETGEPERYTVAPNPALMTPEEAAAALARIPKPVSCTAVRRADHIAIECRRVPLADEIARHQHMLGGDYRQFLASMLRSLGGGENALLMLKGTGRPILMSANEISKWMDEYDLERMGLGFSLDDADEEAAGAGAIAAIHFRGPINYTSFSAVAEPPRRRPDR